MSEHDDAALMDMTIRDRNALLDDLAGREASEARAETLAFPNDGVYGPADEEEEAHARWLDSLGNGWLPMTIDRNAKWRESFEVLGLPAPGPQAMPACWREADDRTWERLLDPASYRRNGGSDTWAWLLQSTAPNPEYTVDTLPEQMIVACCPGKSCWPIAVRAQTSVPAQRADGIGLQLAAPVAEYAYVRESNDENYFGPVRDLATLVAMVNDPYHWPRRDDYDFDRGF